MSLLGRYAAFWACNLILVLYGLGHVTLCWPFLLACWHIDELLERKRCKLKEGVNLDTLEFPSRNHIWENLKSDPVYRAGFKKKNNKHS